MRKAIRQGRSDIVIAFMGQPAVLAELATLPRREFAVIALELNLDVFGRSLRRQVHYHLHRLADAVVSNSHAQRERMLELAPYLKDRTQVIINGVDLERYSPRPDDEGAPARTDRLQLVAAIGAGSDL